MWARCVLSVAIVTLLLWGGNTGAQQAGTSGKVVVGSLKIVNLTPLYIAEKLGYFRQEGMDVEVKFLGGGAESLAILAAEKLNIIYTNWTSFLQARAAGFNFLIIAGNASAPRQAPTGLALLARQDGPVRTLKDLEGRTVAVNNLKNVTWLTAVVSLEKNKVDPKRVNFRELPWPNIPDAVLKGQVDAAVLPEPFSTILQQTGKARILSYPYIDTQPGLPLAGWVAEEGWIKEHPQVVAKFVRSIRRGMALMNEGKSEGMQYLIEFTQMKPELAQKVIMDILDIQVDIEGLQRYADLMVRHGLLKGPMDVSKSIYKAAP